MWRSFGEFQLAQSVLHLLIDLEAQREQGLQVVPFGILSTAVSIDPNRRLSRRFIGRPRSRSRADTGKQSISAIFAKHVGFPPAKTGLVFIAGLSGPSKSKLKGKNRIEVRRSEHVEERAP